MSVTEQIAKHFRASYFGPNWTGANLRDKLEDVTWQQATQKIESHHSIATLIQHMNYYLDAVTKVMQGGPLDAQDALSFDHPPVESEQGWQDLLERTWSDAESLAQMIEAMPDEKLWELMADEKYGTWYRNLQGIIEHNHYHLGQIALIKTLVT